jgi:hypothetical protein
VRRPDYSQPGLGLVFRERLCLGVSKGVALGKLARRVPGASAEQAVYSR